MLLSTLTLFGLYSGFAGGAAFRRAARPIPREISAEKANQKLPTYAVVDLKPQDNPAAAGYDEDSPPSPPSSLGAAQSPRKTVIVTEYEVETEVETQTATRQNDPGPSVVTVTAEAKTVTVSVSSVVTVAEPISTDTMAADPSAVEEPEEVQSADEAQDQAHSSYLTPDYPETTHTATIDDVDADADAMDYQGQSVATGQEPLSTQSVTHDDGLWHTTYYLSGAAYNDGMWHTSYAK